MVKNIIPFLIFIFSIFYDNLNAQWYEVSGAIYDVCYINANTLIAAGEGGTIRKSIDNGASWKVIDSKISWDLYTINFVDENIGFISGQEGLIKTTDGGETWQVSYQEEFDLYYLVSWDGVYFVNKNIGYLVDNSSNTYKSTDGGNNWVYLCHYPVIKNDAGYVNQIFFKDENNGFMCYTPFGVDGNGSVYYTNNGAKSWNIYYDGGRYIQFVNDNVGFMLCLRNIIRKTIDGGNSWEEYKIGIDDFLVKINFVNEKIGYAVGLLGNILKTTDGGVTWVAQNSKINYSLNSIACDLNGNSCVAVGENATILKYNQKANVWDKISQSPPNNINLNKASFVNDTMALVAGSYGFYAKSGNGGATWSTYMLKKGVANLDINFTNARTGYMLTSEGCIYKTTDGGNVWDSLDINDAGNILKLYFYNDSFGFAFGNHTYKTVDGGKTWTNLPISLFDIQFLDDSTGFYLDHHHGQIYKSFDKGETWLYWDYPDCEPCTYTGKRICFVNSSVGYIADDVLFKTTDGGASWKTLQYTESNLEYCVALNFISENTGYLFTNYDYIYKTTDGGNTWTTEDYRYKNTYLTQMCVSKTDGIVVGQTGQIFMPASFNYKSNTIKRVEKELSVSPNPSKTNKVYINADLVSADIKQLEVWDLGGRLVLKEKLNTKNFPIELELPNYLNGIYVVHLIGEKSTYKPLKIILLPQ